MLRRLRDDSSKNNHARDAYADTLSAEQKRQKLEQIMEADGGEELCEALPELVKTRRAQQEEGVKELEVRAGALRRVIAGYQDALGGSLGSMQMMNQPQQQNPVLQQ